MSDSKAIGLRVFIGSVRLLAITIVLALVAFIGIGTYSFYGLVVYPKIERVKIDLDAQRIERITLAAKSGEKSENGASSQK
ncbi:hypothetical protein J8B38_20655 [Vibrio parahaemolyticus]|uniref:hypothetical protein n=1 Tax=Vibrio parahaemolyticus TaxID=670 RepID=UPI0004B4C3FF|nr:hypothetical protein [Vibrio parahaemolyticus]EGQ7681774.1 hypothetical protein [Vibrio parahaemolyticus]EHH3659050.1 hypothetical protein [Vibrio parahaemolyticus]EJK2408354.1 hypothetical protein [Vibrio parahaemolyticus]ELA7337632.1 hypothetical protein [Vibrio parahaemolyticus]ELA7934550.1 hypothetical protein [Vibrio parahaemolyticus]